ncbi:MAG: cupin domain-containing protein [Opitutales bacterium]
MKLNGEDTEGRFALIESENLPGIGPPLHIHRREDEAFYIIEGEVEFTLGERRTVAGAGTTVFLPKDSLHTWKVVGTQRARFLIMLMPAGGEQYFRELSALGAVGPPDMAAVLEVSGRYGIEFPGLGS